MTAMEMDYETDYSEKISEYAPWNMSYIDRVQYKSIRIEQNRIFRPNYIKISKLKPYLKKIIHKNTISTS